LESIQREALRMSRGTDGKSRDERGTSQEPRPSVCHVHLAKGLRSRTARGARSINQFRAIENHAIVVGVTGAVGRFARIARIARNLWYRDRVSDAKKLGGDQIMRSLIEGGQARVVVATATHAVREMVLRHKTLGVPAVALGRGALAGLLLATLTKDEEQVTLQVLGNGPLGGVTVDARSSGRVRGFVKRPGALAWDPALASAARLSLGDAIGKQGVVNVTRDLGLAQNYSGQVALSTGEIDAEVEHYLNTSEQIDSVLHCETLVDSDGNVTAAAGLLVQTLPQAHGTAVVEFLRDTLRGPAFTSVVKNALAKDNFTPEAIARAALGQCGADMQVLDLREVSFFCPCTRERAESTLGMLKPEDLKEMILETNLAEVTCNFCGQQYHFSEIEIERIRRKQGKPQPRS
jgi:molecular chaperone Hsp33